MWFCVLKVTTEPKKSIGSFLPSFCLASTLNTRLTAGECLLAQQNETTSTTFHLLLLFHSQYPKSVGLGPSNDLTHPKKTPNIRISGAGSLLSVRPRLATFRLHTCTVVKSLLKFHVYYILLASLPPVHFSGWKRNSLTTSVGTQDTFELSL